MSGGRERLQRALGVLRASALVGGVLIVSACSSPATEQGSAPVVDARGCPDLRGSYSVYLDTAEAGVNFDGTPFEELPFGAGSWVALTAVAGVVIDGDPAGDVSFRFRLADEEVMKEVRTMDEFRPQRYRDWYALLQPAGRADYVSQYGEQAYQRRVAELGPTTEAGLTLRHGRDFSCEGGAMLIPRASGNPVRLTRNGNGDLLGESREYRTFGVTVWCGDGCRDMKIPTGVYTGRLVWRGRRTRAPGPPPVSRIFPRCGARGWRSRPSRRGSLSKPCARTRTAMPRSTPFAAGSLRSPPEACSCWASSSRAVTCV